jgi:cytochrome bd-type quinol oxidase subunit 2
MSQRGGLRLVFGSSLAALVLGFMWGALFAGVPYPDGTPEQNARFAFHANAATVLMAIGIVLFIIGMVANLMRDSVPE